MESFLTTTQTSSLTSSYQQYSNLTNMNQSVDDYASFSFINGQSSWENFLVELYRDIKLWRDIFMVFGTLLTCLGFVFNMLCIMISRSKLFRNSSFPYYVKILAIVDTLNILFRFVIPQLIECYVRFVLVHDYKVGSGVDTSAYDDNTAKITSEYHCSLFLYAYNSLTLISVWLMVAISFERWVVIKITMQSKYMVKLRAMIILGLIFGLTLTLNVFDLAPGLYLKPQWYANLTLLCERDDIKNNNDTSEIRAVYKNLGPIRFNTETFALTRTILQTVVPFLLVLFFNSLIIYNFKKIKRTAIGNNNQNKTSPCLSYASYSGMENNKNKKFSCFGSKSKREKERWRNNKCQKQHKQQSRDDKKQNFVIINNIEAAESLCASEIEANELTDQSFQSQSPITGQVTGKNSPDKFYKGSFLMPPNLSITNKRHCSPSIDANSSDKLSLMTNSNLTATTNLNQTTSNSNIGRDDDIDILRNSKVLITINQVDQEEDQLNNNKKTITTQTSRKFHSKRRNYKHRLNRETDIMLIVLSFSILISQLPCSVAWYLIYYRNILQELNYYYYFTARTPIILFILRLVEMLYFSLNFFFYISLSPTLRKEIKDYLTSYNFISKAFLKNKKQNIFDKNNDNNKSNLNNNNNNKSKNLVIEPEVKIQADMDSNNTLDNEQSFNKCVISNSSDDYIDFIHKLRSLSDSPKLEEQELNITKPNIKIVINEISNRVPKPVNQ